MSFSELSPEVGSFLEQLVAEAEAQREFRICKICGCNGDGECGRVIAKDGSVWPSRDTGYRMPSTFDLKGLWQPFNLQRLADECDRAADR